MRLIDANRLLEEIKTLPIMSNWGETFFPRLVQDQPTVDAEPVVRCKDCEHGERYERKDGTAGYYCGHSGEECKDFEQMRWPDGNDTGD